MADIPPPPRRRRGRPRAPAGQARKVPLWTRVTEQESDEFYRLAGKRGRAGHEILRMLVLRFIRHETHPAAVIAPPLAGGR